MLHKPAIKLLTAKSSFWIVDEIIQTAAETAVGLASYFVDAYTARVALLEVFCGWTFAGLNGKSVSFLDERAKPTLPPQR